MAPARTRDTEAEARKPPKRAQGEPARRKVAKKERG
jgi:hypothetical protein